VAAAPPPLPRRVDVVLLATLAGVLFGALAVAVRVALRRARDLEAGVFVCALVGFLVAAAVVLPLAARGVEAEGLCAFALVGAFVPGLSQVNATQSLWGVLFAAAFIRRAEAVGPRLVAASALVVAGGVLTGVTR
jgi:hypothetical protein